ncbi:MAG: cytochrome c oxidase subunit II [Alphaproteobacteria bacterium]
MAKLARLIALMCLSLVVAPSAWAQQPQAWKLGLQEAATPVMEQVNRFHNQLLVIITVITLFVLALMIYTMWRFNEKRNPVPSTTTHNTLVEVLWTAVPILILVFVAVPSFRLLYFADAAVDADMTVKVIGRQWYWTYEYPDHGDFAFDAFIVPDDEIEEGQVRLLEADARMVVPVGAKVRLITTSSDVLHAFAMPAFGVKIDSVPGRLNETWFQVTKAGVYYGQCSELCGTGHGFMPIVIEAVPEAQFNAWIVEAQAKYATADDSILEQRPMRVSAAQFVRPAYHPAN